MHFEKRALNFGGSQPTVIVYKYVKFGAKSKHLKKHKVRYPTSTFFIN